MQTDAGQMQNEPALSDADLVANLRALMANARQRSATARLRVVFDIIEELHNRGYTLDQILAELRLAGLDMPITSFKSAIQRIRPTQKDDRVRGARSHSDAPATCPHCGSALVGQAKASSGPVSVVPVKPAVDALSPTPMSDAYSGYKRTGSSR